MWIGTGNELLLSDLLGSDPDIVNRGIEQESEKQTLLRAVEKLDPREKQIMELRFGLQPAKGAHAKGSCRCTRHFAVVHLKA